MPIPAALLLAVGKELVEWVYEQWKARGVDVRKPTTESLPIVSVGVGDRVLLSTSDGGFFTGSVQEIHDLRAATVRLDTGKEVTASRGAPGWVPLPRP